MGYVRSRPGRESAEMDALCLCIDILDRIMDIELVLVEYIHTYIQ